MAQRQSKLQNSSEELWIVVAVKVRLGKSLHDNQRKGAKKTPLSCYKKQSECWPKVGLDHASNIRSQTAQELARYLRNYELLYVCTVAVQHNQHLLNPYLVFKRPSDGDFELQPPISTRCLRVLFVLLIYQTDMKKGQNWPPYFGYILLVARVFRQTAL